MLSPASRRMKVHRECWVSSLARSMRVTAKSAAGLGKPPRTDDTAIGSGMGLTMAGTGMPASKRLLYMHTVYAREAPRRAPMRRLYTGARFAAACVLSTK
ncbi:hypothetical protein CT3_29120 [Comamonas terrigena NBRC 13299]|nr:hypothetical protein CT3_29120 [Comamonas terrigena NBRC 13299]